MEEKKNKCCLCGETAELIHDNFPGYQEPHSFNIYFCTKCETSFASPIMTNTKIFYDNIYKNMQKEKVPGYSRYWKYSQRIKAKKNPLEYLASVEETYWSIREALAMFNNRGKDLKILEIGSGLGYLTYALNKAGYNTIGIDISKKAVEAATKSFGNFYLYDDLFNFSEKNSNSFDIVMFTELIEHIPNPIEFVNEAVKLLKSDGKIVLTTPNKSLFPNDIIWKTELPPIHYWWFSESSIEFISKQIGLNLSFINFSKYYKNQNNKFIDLQKIRKEQLKVPSSVFDANGFLIYHNRKIERTILKKIMLTIPVLNKVAFLVKKVFNQNIIFCKERGLIICAILEK